MAWRHWFCVILVFSLFVVIFAKLYQLHIQKRAFLQHQGDVRVIRQVTTPAERGIIVDRNGAPLVVSSVVYDIWINPQTVNFVNRKWITALNLLNVKRPLWQKKIQHHTGQFAYLKRHVVPPIAEKIAALHLKGVFMKQEYTRFYLEGEYLAQVLGFTGIDGQGQEGLELYYHDWLKGKEGVATHVQDLKGNIIGAVGDAKLAESGQPIVLSIDRRIQYLTYDALKQAVLKYGASSGSAVILAAKTGEVLAMANYPSYNPNTKNSIGPTNRRNRVLTDQFEAGSTIKTFAMASVLESGKYQVNDTIDTFPGYYKIANNIVQDHHNNGVLSLNDVLKRSSNVGMSKLVLSLPENDFPKLLSRIGFGQATGVEFPGESTGFLPQPRRWGQFPLATLSFGYGMAVTSLQLAQAYAAVANGGIRRKPSLLKQDKVPLGEVVMNPAIAKKIMAMLVTVTETGGTAVRASVPGYIVAGKTGTARKAIAGGYAEDKYIAVFAGIVPANDPKLVMVVMMDETQGKNYYGGIVAAPVFSKVMRQVLPLLGVLPEHKRLTG